LHHTLRLFIGGRLYTCDYRKCTARQTPKYVYIRAGMTATLVPQPFPVFRVKMYENESLL